MDDGGGNKTPTRITAAMASAIRPLITRLLSNVLRTATHTYVLDDALSDLAQRLGARFMRVHRNALVARAAVRALERRALADDDEPGQGEPWAVCVAPVDEWLVVSRRQMAAVREAIEAGSL